MQKTTKTSRNRTAPIKAANATKKATSIKTQKSTVAAPAWLNSNTSRPKTLIVQMQRTANGYTIKEATVLSPINQHASRSVSVSVRAVTEDINRRGIL